MTPKLEKELETLNILQKKGKEIPKHTRLPNGFASSVVEESVLMPRGKRPPTYKGLKTNV